MVKAWFVTPRTRFDSFGGGGKVVKIWFVTPRVRFDSLQGYDV